MLILIRFLTKKQRGKVTFRKWVISWWSECVLVLLLEDFLSQLINVMLYLRKRRALRFRMHLCWYGRLVIFRRRFDLHHCMNPSIRIDGSVICDPARALPIVVHGTSRI